MFAATCSTRKIQPEPYFTAAQAEEVLLNISSGD